MKKVRPGTAASCLTKRTDRVELHEKGEARYGFKLFKQDNDRVEIHEKGEARYSGKLFSEDDRQSRDP